MMEDGVGVHLDYLSEGGDRKSAARIDRQNLYFADMKTDKATGRADN
jgi:hypothetical protein